MTAALHESSLHSLPLLARGAAIYVCGDGRHMAPAVEAAFVSLLTQAGHSPEAATALLETWKQEGRYLQDVWAS